MKGVEIKKIRKKLNKTQSEFGEMLGVSMRTIQNWESEKRKIPKNIEIILKSILNTPIESIGIPDTIEDKFINITDDELSIYFIKHKDRLLKNELISTFIKKEATKVAKNYYLKDLKDYEL